MTNTEVSKPQIGRRKAVSLSPEKLIYTGYLQPENLLPFVVKPAVEGLSLATWAENNQQFI